MTEELILIRHSGLRLVSEDEVLTTLTSAEASLPRQVIHVNTMPFASAVEAGDWSTSEHALRRSAREIHEAADSANRSVDLRYFGLAEIPHVVALGAFVGDERHVTSFDYDRVADRWSWPSPETPLVLQTRGQPADVVNHPGIAVLRVAISATITDEDVTRAVGASRIADLLVTTEDRTPQVHLVRAQADLEHVRSTIRAALAAIVTMRPSLDAIHLFLAAPVPACFVIGQELHLRSSVPVYTYRYRTAEGQTSYTEAIRLTGTESDEPTLPLTDEEKTTAGAARTTWREALENVIAFANSRKQESEPSAIWYQTLSLPALAAVTPFPALPPLWKLVATDHRVADDPHEGDYNFDQDTRHWHLGDRLLLGLHRAANGDRDATRDLIQLFLFHEYVHRHNRLTGFTSQDVGAFPNCLEHIDYAADLYGLFHQLAWATQQQELATSEAQRLYLIDTIDLIIRSFWAFNRRESNDEWQVRRLRRYLNWYWRHVQVKRADTLGSAVASIVRQPAIELAGIECRFRRGRLIANLTRHEEKLFLGIVSENEQFVRIADSPVTNLHELVESFRKGDHEGIRDFFGAVYDEATR